MPMPGPMTPVQRRLHLIIGTLVVVCSVVIALITDDALVRVAVIVSGTMTLLSLMVTLHRDD